MNAPETQSPQAVVRSSADALLAVLRDSNRAPDDYPTPTGMTLGELREHVTQSAGGFVRATGGEPTGEVATDVRAVVAALEDRDEPVTFPFGEMSADDARGAVAIELLVHAWDISQASNTVLAVSEDLAAAVCSDAQRLIGEKNREMGAFGPERPAPGDATPMEELAAFTGRDLSWREDD